MPTRVRDRLDICKKPRIEFRGVARFRFEGVGVNQAVAVRNFLTVISSLCL
jgi:hypothetical protein